MVFFFKVLSTEHALAWSRWHTVRERRRNVTWQMSDKKMFFSGRRQTLKTDMRCLWKLTKPESVLRSEGAEDQRLPEPQLTEPFTKFTNFFRLDTSCGMFDGAGEVLLWKYALSCYRNTFIFFLPEEEPELLNPFELKHVVIYAPFCLSFPLDYAPYIRQHFAYITITPKQNHTYTRTSSYREHDLITFSSTMLEENLYFCYCQKVSW